MVRASLRAKAVKASASTPNSRPALPPIQPTKKSKRTTRHAALLARVATSSAITKSSKKNVKRKESRASRQNLITGLSSLADALPDADNEGDWEDWEHDVFDQSSKDAMRSLQQKKKAEGEGKMKMKMKTIKSKPGAQKRKEKVLREECVRFGKNLAIMNSAAVAVATEGKESGTVQGPVPAVSAWAALRGFIANTMERKEEFVQMEAGKSGAGDGMDVDV